MGIYLGAKTAGESVKTKPGRILEWPLLYAAKPVSGMPFCQLVTVA
jgi:hypothetical protein